MILTRKPYTNIVFWWKKYFKYFKIEDKHDDANI